MNVLSTVKEKAIGFAVNPKTVKAVNTVTNGISAVTAGVTALGVSAFNACAEETDVGAIVASAASVSQIREGYSPFLEPAIIILCAVGGVRLGMRFLKGALH